MATTLGQFIQEYMADHGNLSAYQMADLVKCSHTTINKFMWHGINPTYGGRKIGDPDFDFVKQLARATSTDVLAICALIIGAKEFKDFTPEDLTLAQTINSLSDETKQNIYAIIRAMRKRKGDTGDDEIPLVGS